MSRAYYSKEVKQFLFEDNSFILGKLASNHQFSLDEKQRNSWINQIQILKENLSTLNRGHILFEYTIPRMGKRVDVILIVNGIIFLMEFKVSICRSIMTMFIDIWVVSDLINCNLRKNGRTEPGFKSEK